MPAQNAAFTFTIVGITFLGLAHIAAAQTQSAGPMFSTPASRSTTGAPILNEPTSDTNTILNSAGGGNVNQARPSTPQQQVQQPAMSRSPAKQESFGNWTVECASPEQAARQCQITGKTASADKKQTILVLSIAPSPDTKSTLYQAALPLGIAVQQKVQLSVGGSFSTELAVNRCTQQGCLLEGSLETPLLDALKKGTDAKFTVTTPEGTQIPISLSLEGFSQAWMSLSST